MIELLIENTVNILGIVAIVGAGIFGSVKYKNKKLRDSWNMNNRLNNLEEDFDEEKRSADIHHKNLYDKINLIGQDVSFIRGKISNLKI